MRKREKGKLTMREAIITILAAKGSATLDYLVERTGYNKNLVLVMIGRRSHFYDNLFSLG